MSTRLRSDFAVCKVTFHGRLYEAGSHPESLLLLGREPWSIGIGVVVGSEKTCPGSGVSTQKRNSEQRRCAFAMARRASTLNFGHIAPALRCEGVRPDECAMGIPRRSTSFFVRVTRYYRTV